MRISHISEIKDDFQAAEEVNLARDPFRWDEGFVTCFGHFWAKLGWLPGGVKDTDHVFHALIGRHLPCGQTRCAQRQKQIPLREMTDGKARAEADSLRE